MLGTRWEPPRPICICLCREGIGLEGWTLQGPRIPWRCLWLGLPVSGYWAACGWLLADEKERQQPEAIYSHYSIDPHWFKIWNYVTLTFQRATSKSQRAQSRDRETPLSHLCPPGILFLPRCNWSDRRTRRHRGMEKQGPRLARLPGMSHKAAGEWYKCTWPGELRCICVSACVKQGRYLN